MKVFVFSLRNYDEKAFLEKFCEKYNIEFGYTNETPCLENVHLAAGYDAVDIITTPTSAEVIDKYHEMGIKCIATRTIGFDHIDYKHAASLGIGVVNISYSPATVADFTVMMMLMGLRKVKYIKLRADVQDYSLEGKIARELPQCTVGVIGTGRIGQTVIQDLSGFGCKILANDPNPKDSLGDNVEYVDLDTLIRESDIITLHAPAFDSTYHMLDEAAFAKMKDGVGIVNCARGSLIDTEALIENLDNGKVGFACLDVIENEGSLFYFNRMGEPLGNHDLAILESYPNVIVMPHMAFYTDEAVSNMVENSLLGIKEYFETGKCVNIK